MDDAVDLLDHPIDDRARRAAADLRRAASLRTLPDLPRARSTVGRTAALTLAIAGALVAGLIVIGNRQNDVEPAGPNDDLHWVIDGLPQGWAPVEVRGPGSGGGQSDDNASPIITIFGSDEGPAGPVLEAYVYDDSFSPQPAQGAGASNYEEHTLDGVDVVLASSAAAARLAWAKIDDQWVPLQASGMSDDQLLDAAAHLSVGPDGSVQIVAEHLPDNVTLLASGPIAAVAPAWWAGVASQGTAPGTISISYKRGSAGGPSLLSLTVSRAVAGQLAFVALANTEVTPTDVDGLLVWQLMTEQGLPASAAWQRDDQFFVLTTSEPGKLDLPTLAATVRRATPDEWSALPTANASQPGRTTSTEQPSGTVLTGVDEPAATVVSVVVSDEVRDIALDWTIADRQPHQATLEATLPDGSASHVQVTIVGDSISLGASDLGFMTFPWADDAETKLEFQGFGAVAVTHDARATQLRVLRASGDRYTVDLVTLTGEPTTKFAVLTVPYNEFVSSDLLDADGNVIRHFAPG